MRSIIVYGKTKDRAYEKLDQILFNTPYGLVKDVRRSNTSYTVDLTNGDRYTAVIANDHARGHRWQYAYIDSNISHKILIMLVVTRFCPFEDQSNDERLYCEYY